MATVFRSFVVLDCILLMMLGIGVHAGKCPRNVMKQAKRCMRQVQGFHHKPNNLLNMMTPAGMDGTKKLCRDGKIQNAFACLNRLYSSCANSREGMRHLDMMVDVGKWRTATENICNSLQYLQNNAECESKARAEFTPCAYQAKLAFERDMDMLQADLATLPAGQESGASMAKVNIGCSFTTKILICLQEPFEKHCPHQMAVLLRDTFQEFIPPACAKRAMQRSVDPYPKYEVPEPDPVDSPDNGNSPDIVQIVHQDNGNDKYDEEDDDVKDTRKTSFDEEYNDVKMSREGVVGAARSQGKEKEEDVTDKDGARVSVGSLVLVTVLGAMHALFHL